MPWATGFIVASLVGVLAMLALIWLRGVWLDEIWTRWLTDPHLTLQGASRRWSFEPHPPVYYFYIWSLRHVFDGGIVALRASNALAILPLILAARDCRSRTGNAFFAYAYAVMVLLSMPIVVYLAELRAYYLMAVLYAALLLLLATDRFDRGSGINGSAGRRLTAIGGLAVLTSSLHYLSFAVVAITLGIEILYRLTQRAYVRFVVLAAIVLLGAATIAPTLVHYLRIGSVNQATAVQGAGGLGIAGRALLLALSSNILAVAFVVVSAIARGRQMPPGDRWSRDGVVLAIASGAAIIGSFLLLNALKPFLVPRYLLQLAPLACMAAAAFLTRFAGRPAALVIALNGLVACLGAVVAQGPNKRWEHHVGVIRAELAACPTTRLFAVDPFELGQPSPPPRAGDSPLDTMRAIVASGYREIAGRRGIALAGFLPDRSARRNAPTGITGDGCPIILWLESNYWRPNIGPDELAARAGLPVAALRRYRPDVRRSGDHLLVIFRPDGTG